MTDKIPPETEQAFAWVLHDVFRLFQRAWNRRLRDSGVGISSAQSRVLASLYREGGITQTELAEETEMEKAPLGRLLDRMEEQGLIERRPDPADRRVRRVYHSARVEALEPRMWEPASAMFQTALAGMNEREVAALMALMGRLKQNLLNDDAPAPNAEDDGDAGDEHPRERMAGE
ncbi:MarR family transcriptional regulator [Parvibaculum sp.]|uniref:MarR family winged helix-turn-helix transcriptional regulator n=1 Tax=Parvibaculum sp. TaxID=2024848 RepID=UPI002BC2F60E|nr:MarR family transcriptional regulator [Parvibaculum sp.]HUD49904.1 MarR family transcriptional regulator [Parvibaculum sp.]